MPNSLRTDRLLLRPFYLRDAPSFRQSCGHYNILKNTATWDWPASESYFHERIKRATLIEGRHQAGFAIVKNGRVIGSLGGHRDNHAESAEPVFWIGYMIGEKYWGQGYMSEAVLALCDHIFKISKTRHIYAEHFIDNLASGRVLQKVGFEYVREALPVWSRARKAYVNGLQYKLSREKLVK